MAEEKEIKSDEKLEELTFEEIMKMLDEKTKQVQEGSLSLDDMISAYEQGMKLVGIANEKLDSAERKIVEIKRNIDGSEDEEEL